jgi:hypothetical protein
MTKDLNEEDHQVNLDENDSPMPVKNEDCCGEGCCDSDDCCDNDDCACCQDK